MTYRGKLEYAQARKMRTRNTRLYRLAHWPLWIWVFFLAPGPLTFSLFAHGFGRANLAWLGAGSARHRHRRAARQPARRRARALHPALRRGQAESAVSPRLLHLRVERRAQLRAAESRRSGHRRRHRHVVHEADLYVRLCAAVRDDSAAGRGRRAAAGAASPPRAKARSAATSMARCGRSSSRRRCCWQSGRRCPTHAPRA